MFLETGHENFSHWGKTVVKKEEGSWLTGSIAKRSKIMIDKMMKGGVGWEQEREIL